jgi:hypothetical protein
MPPSSPSAWISAMTCFMDSHGVSSRSEIRAATLRAAAVRMKNSRWPIHIRLVEPQRYGCLGMARIQADDRQTHALSACQCQVDSSPLFEADPCRSRCSPGEDSGNAFRCHAHLPCQTVVPVDPPRRGSSPSAYVQANILLHGCAPLPMPSSILSDSAPLEAAARNYSMLQDYDGRASSTMVHFSGCRTTD